MRQAGVKAMKGKGGGVIINMASIASVIGIRDRFAYGMTKGAVLTMTYATATDHMHDNIRCNAIAPVSGEIIIILDIMVKYYLRSESVRYEWHF